MNSFSSSEMDIRIENVSKTFKTGLGKTKTGVKDLTLQVPKGRVVGLLGPNGSGKSTTIKMILGFLKPSSGQISVCGHQVPSKASRSFIGYLPENPRFPKFLSGRTLLNFYGKLLGLSGSTLDSRIEFLLDLVSLKSAADERVQGYSKGMTQRLAIAQSLLNEPRLLIFDEPMSGLDPLGRKDIRKLIARIHEELPNATIFFSSHILEDVEQLCSMVALLKKGHLHTFCPIEDLLKSETQTFEITTRPRIQNSSESLAKVKAVTGIDELIAFLNEAKINGLTVSTISSPKRTLEETLFSEGGK